MKKSAMTAILIWGLFVFLSAIPATASEKTGSLRQGSPFPEVTMPAPSEPALCDYLGIESGGRFSIKDIEADLVLVEIMNINCGSCQKQAPVYNELFSLIESTGETRGRIKMLAIAAGNMAKYVKLYTDHFTVPYPVVSDPDLKIYDILGRGPTPHAVYVKKIKTGNTTVIMDSHLGFESEHKKIFNRLLGFLDMSPTDIHKTDPGEKEKVRTSPTPISDGSVRDLLKTALTDMKFSFASIDTADFADSGKVYVIRKEAKTRHGDLFARVVNRPPPCDQCHDVQYIYVFRPDGEIVGILPIQLTKYGNEQWSKEDLQRIRSRIVGRNIDETFRFDPEFDAVSSATITSMIIFNTLDKGKPLYDHLLDAGLIEKSTP